MQNERGACNISDLARYARFTGVNAHARSPARPGGVGRGARAYGYAAFRTRNFAKFARGESRELLLYELAHRDVASVIYNYKIEVSSQKILIKQYVRRPYFTLR